MTTEMTNEYASKGIAGTGLGLGIAGTALGILNGGLGLIGNGSAKSSVQYVTKDDFALGLQISQKDCTIARLEAEKETDAKIVDTYKVLANKISDLTEKVANNREDANTRIQNSYMNLDAKITTNKNCQDMFNTTQVGINASTAAQIDCMKHQLHNISKYSVPWYDVTKSAFSMTDLSAN